ncbi:hypothetical protein LOAG_06583 [Loa loa]|uniref:Uncharacterized protein n=1 Tax=Loa loa TaxID=7209 RepID=A0A1S0TZ67_LOALO|nr:hypothetical protein LOAG_06583 [Loa loa]EFO21903.1 hypothetical protein LOAG_06583 [Loa loa]
MSFSLWYTLLYILSFGSLNSPQHIVIQTGCFNIYHPCLKGYRSRQNSTLSYLLMNLSGSPSTISPSSVITRRLLIRTKYVNDLTTTATSLTLPLTTATTTLSPIWPSFLTTLLSSLRSKTKITVATGTTISTTTIISTTTTTSTTIANTTTFPETTRNTENMPFTAPSMPEEVISSSPDTVVEKQFTPRRGKPHSW